MNSKYDKKYEKERESGHIHFYINPDLKIKFQIECIKNKKSMSEQLIEFIKDFVSENNKD
jgi:hypothetical protein